MQLSNLREKLNDGRIFSIRFTKRTTGEERLMVARLGVDRRRGGERKWTDDEKGLLTVWDLQKDAYRCVPLEGIIEVKHHGRVEHG